MLDLASGGKVVEVIGFVPRKDGVDNGTMGSSRKFTLFFGGGGVVVWWNNRMCPDVICVFGWVVCLMVVLFFNCWYYTV